MKHSGRVIKNKMISNCLYKKAFITSILLVSFAFYCNVIKSQSRIYLSNDNHTDYMWTADAATYDTAFVGMIDAWMANNNATNANPPIIKPSLTAMGLIGPGRMQNIKVRRNSKTLSTR